MHRELLFDFRIVLSVYTSKTTLGTRIVPKTIVTIIGITKVLTLLARVKSPIRAIDLVFLILVAIGLIPIVVTNAFTRTRFARTRPT